MACGIKKISVQDPEFLHGLIWVFDTILCILTIIWWMIKVVVKKLKRQIFGNGWSIKYFPRMKPIPLASLIIIWQNYTRTLVWTIVELFIDYLLGTTLLYTTDISLSIGFKPSIWQNKRMWSRNDHTFGVCSPHHKQPFSSSNSLAKGNVISDSFILEAGHGDMRRDRSSEMQLETKTQ
jgi:hypothetical protein